MNGSLRRFNRDRAGRQAGRVPAAHSHRGRIVPHRGDGGSSGGAHTGVRGRDSGAFRRTGGRWWPVCGRHPADRVRHPAHPRRQLRQSRLRLRLRIRPGQPLRHGRPDADAARRAIPVLRPDGDSGDTLAGLDHQPRQRHLLPGVRQSGMVQRLLARPAPLGPTAQVRQLVDGYVAGYNRYLRDTGVAHLPDPTCRGTGLGHARSPRTTSGPSCTTSTRADGHTPRGPSQDIGNGATGTDHHAPPAQPPASTGACQHRHRASNGWALGRTPRSTTTGCCSPTRTSVGRLRPLLPGAADHPRRARRVRCQPVRLASGGDRPYPGLAWTHTVSHAQRFTLYQLALVPGDPTSYLVDGQAVPMTRQKVTVTVREHRRDSCPPSPAPSTARSTGRVLATGWTATTAFALDDANADNLRSMNEWLAMDTSQNLDQLRRGAEHLSGHARSMYTTRHRHRGHRLLRRRLVVPNVTDAEAARCIDTPAGRQATPTPSSWTARPRPVAGAATPTRSNPASSVRATTRTDPHRLRRQLQQQPLAHQPGGPDHRLPGAIYGDTATERSCGPGSA